MTTLACCFSEYVHIGAAQPNVGRIYLSPHTASLCHVQSVDNWGLFPASLLHRPSLKHLETSVTKPSKKRESNDNQVIFYIVLHIIKICETRNGIIHSFVNKFMSCLCESCVGDGFIKEQDLNRQMCENVQDIEYWGKQFNNVFVFIPFSCHVRNWEADSY